MTNSSDAQMIVPYQWILNIDEKEPKTIASKMILFRGERVFRVGLKNHVQSPILLFLAADLNRLGMRVEDVMCGVEDAGTSPAKMTQMKREDQIGIDGSLQLFTINLFKMVTGQRTFVFRICIKGTDSGYSYQLSDRLAKDQLWAALENQQHLFDVVLIVKDKTFAAHKAILAARSPVFADKFEKKQPVREGRHQIRIDDVEPSTVENFLHFIYTGEPISSLANEQLLMLAEKYRLTTLISLCKVALKKIETKQMVDFMKRFNMEADKIPPSSQIRPEKDTEIFFDRTTPTFRCALTFNNRNYGESQCLMQYHNEDIFFAYYNKEVVRGHGSSPFGTPYSFLVHFSCAKRRNFGFKIENIYVRLKGSNWNKMKSKNVRENPELLHFTVQFQETEYSSCPNHVFEFDIKIVSTIGNYYYELMDEDWLKDLWAAATDQKLTDVDIFVGTVKVMEAHRVILSARSPVLNASLNKIINTRKSNVIFGTKFGVNIVKHFLQFLYTGSLETSASKDTDYKQLLELATMYEVETLKNFCQVVNAFVPLDVEDLTSSLLEL